MAEQPRISLITRIAVIRVMALGLRMVQIRMEVIPILPLVPMDTARITQVVWVLEVPIQTHMGTIRNRVTTPILTPVVISTAPKKHLVGHQ